MSEWDQARHEFQSIPIPEELDARVRAGNANGKKKARRRRFWMRTGATAAACFAMLAAGLNLFPAFAESAANAPVVGGLCRVLTVASYREKSQDMKLSVDEPALDSSSPMAKKINAEIRKRVAEKTAEGKQVVADYKRAFFATGGLKRSGSSMTTA